MSPRHLPLLLVLVVFTTHIFLKFSKKPKISNGTLVRLIGKNEGRTGTVVCYGEVIVHLDDHKGTELHFVGVKEGDIQKVKKEKTAYRDEWWLSESSSSPPSMATYFGYN